MEKIAVFGEKKAGVSYQSRFGVYAVIPDEKKEQIILVQAPNGAWFLIVEKLKREKITSLPWSAN